MYASVKEGEKRVSVIAQTKRREKTLACPDDEKICAGKERIHCARSGRGTSHTKQGGTFKTHVDDQTQQLVDFRLERERFGFFFSRHDDSSNSVCVVCAL